MALLLHIHPDNPNERHIKTVAQCLLDGGIIIYPTDTIYGLGCDIFNHKAVERIARLKNIDPAKAQLSFVCNDLSDLSKYTKSISTPLYRILKNYLPGPYTFILPAKKDLPKRLQSKRKTIGIRIPNNKIVLNLLELYTLPLYSSTLWLPADEFPLFDPEEINEKLGKTLDLVIDGGLGNSQMTSIVSLLDNTTDVIREGSGEVSMFYD